MTRPARARQFAAATPATPAIFESLEQRRYLSSSPVFVPPGGGGDAPAPVASAAPSNPEATVRRPLKVYSWADWGIEGVTPTVWVRMDSRTPEQAAAETIPTLRSRGEGDRALLLWHVGDHFLDRPLDDIVRSGSFEAGPDRQWLTTYFTLLKQAGVTPDYIVLDYEDSVSTWALPRTEVTRVLGDPSLRQHLPAEAQGFTGADFSGPRWREAHAAWNAWAHPLEADALRQAVRDPARAIFGRDVPMSNFNDMNPAVTTYDLNGWALDPERATTVNGWSSPALYVTGDGQLFQREQDPAWANFVRNMNTLRSLLAAGEQVAPWVSDIGYGDNPELWNQQLRQIRASGVDTLLLWNPDRGPAEDQQQFQSVKRQTRDAFAEVLAMPDAPHALASRLPQLPLDAPEVQTLGYAIERATRQVRIPVLDVPDVLDDDALEDVADGDAVEVVPVAGAVPPARAEGDHAGGPDAGRRGPAGGRAARGSRPRRAGGLEKARRRRRPPRLLGRQPVPRLLRRRAAQLPRAAPRRPRTLRRRGGHSAPRPFRRQNRAGGTRPRRPRRGGPKPAVPPAAGLGGGPRRAPCRERLTAAGVASRCAAPSPSSSSWSSSASSPC